MLFPEASYKEPLEMTEMPTLYKRGEALCKELFQSIFANNHPDLSIQSPFLNNKELKSQSEFILPSSKTNKPF